MSPQDCGGRWYSPKAAPDLRALKAQILIYSLLNLGLGCNTEAVLETERFYASLGKMPLTSCPNLPPC